MVFDRQEAAFGATDPVIGVHFSFSEPSNRRLLVTSVAVKDAQQVHVLAAPNRFLVQAPSRSGV
jgi:hypothetical protein